jgi:hypothetical protein
MSKCLLWLGVSRSLSHYATKTGSFLSFHLATSNFLFVQWLSFFSPSKCYVFLCLFLHFFLSLNRKGMCAGGQKYSLSLSAWPDDWEHLLYSLTLLQILGWALGKHEPGSVVLKYWRLRKRKAEEPCTLTTLIAADIVGQGQQN